MTSHITSFCGIISVWNRSGCGGWHAFLYQMHEFSFGSGWACLVWTRGQVTNELWLTLCFAWMSAGELLFYFAESPLTFISLHLLRNGDSKWQHPLPPQHTLIFLLSSHTRQPPFQTSGCSSQFLHPNQNCYCLKLVVLKKETTRQSETFDVSKLTDGTQRRAWWDCLFTIFKTGQPCWFFN